MKKGFTLIELLAVIVILAIIAVIAVPIVLNIINDVKDNASKRSIDMYVKAVENAIARYQLNKGDIPNTYDELKDYIEYNGSEVKCDDFRIYKDGTTYLNQCSVDGKYIEGYSKGNVIGYGTIAYNVISNYGGTEGIQTLSSEWTWTEGTYDTPTSERMNKSYNYYWGTEINFNKTNGRYKLGGTVVQATVEECRAGQKSDGTAITCSYTLSLSTDSETRTGYKVTALTNSEQTETSGLYITAEKTMGASNAFSKKTTASDAGLYKTQDDLGDSYYFRGAPTDNYVKFGTYAEDTTITVLDNNFNEKTVEVKAGSPMYWRIVRINGDGTIRLVYDGIEKVENGVEHTATVGFTKYSVNPTWSETGYGYDIKYLGYTYDVSGTQTNSLIKEVVDTWYENNLEATYGKYIVDSIFCNDREVTDYQVYHDLYMEIYSFAPGTRIYGFNPKLTCTRKEDRHTISELLGNGLLTKPVGLITADEVMMAGEDYSKVFNSGNSANSSYYLYSGEDYWTLSANGADPGALYIFSSISYSSTTFPNNVRPVINLRADVSFTGDGSYETPYEIVMN